LDLGLKQFVSYKGPTVWWWRWR